LLNIVMALIAIVAVLGGDFSRKGYGKRIAISSSCSDYGADRAADGAVGGG
jgi:lipopolysaccharide export system permease protein